MEKLLVVVGPTGVGKTRLGVELAKQYNGEVISGDSMQIYKGMDIGTAKVTPEETQGIFHHLIDVKEPFESYSVSEYQQAVRDCIKEIRSRGKLPIIVGGTGLYIKAVLYDYVFEESETDPLKMQEKYKDYSNEALYQHLMEIDPQATRNIHPNNRRRVLRAIEIYETTGHKKSENEQAQTHTMIYDAYCIGLTLERTQLYQRINQRVDKMMANGLEQEVLALKKQGCTSDLQSMRAIGYKEWFRKEARDEIVEDIKKDSRHYAKRQYTWFNHQMKVNWYDVNIEDFEKTVEEVSKDVNGFLG